MDNRKDVYNQYLHDDSTSIAQLTIQKGITIQETARDIFGGLRTHRQRRRGLALVTKLHGALNRLIPQRLAIAAEASRAVGSGESDLLYELAGGVQRKR